MTFHFRPAIREKTPLIIGLAGPTKSGKTKSAHRLAQGLANGGVVAMLNAEGARGHQYADQFNYVAADIEPPYSPERYTEAIQEVKKLNPAVLIIDSISHMHDGPGGLLDYHDSELDRMAGKDDYKRREKMTWTAWIKPKSAENAFIYALLSLNCPVILCMRAKEKIRIVAGKQPVDLGWQPIASDRISFETIFTLVLPPHCKGVPDLEISEMREPFDSMLKPGAPIDEALGQRLTEWAKGGAVEPTKAQTIEKAIKAAGFETADVLKAWKKGSLADVTDVQAALAWIDKAKAKIADKSTPEPPSPAAETLRASTGVSVTWLISRFDRATDLDLLKADAVLIEELPESVRDEAQESYAYNFDRLKKGAA